LYSLVGFLLDICRSLCRRCAFALTLSGLLSGCTVLTIVRPGPVIVPPARLASSQVVGCGHEHLTQLVGLPFTELANYRLKGHLRVLRPAQGITQDLMPDRLNAQVDGNGVILHLFCG
jgi:hypothetical protein